EALARWDRWNYGQAQPSFIPGSMLMRMGLDPRSVAASVAVNPDGRRLAVTSTLLVPTAAQSWQTFATVWDMQRRTELRVGLVETGPVLAVACGEVKGTLYHVFIVSEKPGRPEQAYEVIVWSPTSRKIAHTLKGHTGRVLCLAVNSTDTLLASGSADRTIRLWSPFLAWRLGVLAG